MAVDRTTSTVTINAAFLQEIKEVNHDLWRLLEQVRKACSNPAHVREQARSVVELLENLRDQLALHFSLEEAYGYFNAPVHVEPRLSELAAALRDEHRILYAGIRDLADDADQLRRSGELPSLAGSVVERFQEYYDNLQQHETRENELIQQAYGDDIGVGD